MKMTVQLFIFYVFALALANPDDPTRNDKYDQKIKTYHLDVPGKEPITIIENDSDVEQSRRQWDDVVSLKADNKNDDAVKNLMTHIVHDFDGSRPRCYGPSCQNGFNEEEDSDDYFLTEKLKNYKDFPQDRLQAISALAAKLQKEKYKADRFPPANNEEDDQNPNNGKVFTTWNRLKVKQHKHPYDDKDGWVTLEPVAWSTSKISKWKPNVKKQKPNHWNDDEDRFPSDDRFSSGDRFPSDERFPSDDRFSSNVDRFQSVSDSGNGYNYQQKRPSMNRPGYINNKLHLQSEYETEIPSKPTWNKPHQAVYPSASSWALDEGRRPSKPNCDHQGHYPDDDGLYYGMSESLVTDHNPPNFPHEYEALHTSSSQKRPIRRPPQVVYAPQEYETDRNSKPPNGDGQWVLLSTTKGYRNKKRQRSLNPSSSTEEQPDVSTMTSHQAVALTVLPVDKAHTNMTTSHGGLLEVEKSFQTVEESKRDMDKKHDLDTAATQFRPVKTRAVKRKIVSNVSPDSSSLLAAVGAGMVPATMAMVVPMMLGRRRRRDINRYSENVHFNNLLYEYRR